MKKSIIFCLSLTLHLVIYGQMQTFEGIYLNRSAWPFVIFQEDGMNVARIQGNAGLFRITSIDGGTTHFSVNSTSGNIGIGTTNLFEKLTISCNGNDISSFRRTNWNNNDRFKINVAGTPGDERFLYSWNNGSDNYLMTIHSNGNLGIGTTNPSNKLEVLQNVTSGGSSAIAQFGNAGIGGWANSGHQVIIGGPNILGYTGLIVYSDATNGHGLISFADGRGDSDSWRGFIDYDHSLDAIAFGTNAIEKMRLTINGNLLIGKSTQDNPAYKLDVAGSIRANEIKVNTTGADFVFEPTYKLRPLAEVETFINQHKHLPDVAPAAEMQTKGVSMGEMQAKLLQKVEEISLYLIEQNKSIIALQKQVEELKKENKALKKNDCIHKK